MDTRTMDAPPETQPSTAGHPRESGARRPRRVTVDGNEAAASIAYRASEVIAIYPITPSSTMGELSDLWSTQGKPNLWGAVPQVTEMQSEGGAAGALHGALQTGALATTFTASQGLLLMVPNMFKIAGELTPAVIHVAARTIATHALSIFGDHSDVYAVRSTGFAMLASGSVQEAHDLALVAHAATLRARIPFLHFFDGFRTSHEVSKIEWLEDADLFSILDEEAIAAHRMRALSPDRPVVRGTAQNPDTFFQAREAINPYYQACPQIVLETMRRFGERTGRMYRLFDYVGHPEADRVIVMMGSGAEAAHEVIERSARQGEKVGLVKVRLYRPFSPTHLLEALPETVRRIAVLDRAKEPGAPGEPLYLDVVTALQEEWQEQHPDLRLPTVIGGRYGLSSKEFHSGHVQSVLEEMLATRPRNHFSVGIVDDVTHSSLPPRSPLPIESEAVFGAIFYGLGADGTVGANKNSIKILGDTTDFHAQGYFVYDSKKSGAITISHLRFGPDPIRSTYLIDSARFIAVHQWQFLDRFDVLEHAAPRATLLLNAPFPPERVWSELPREMQEGILEKELQVYVIDAYGVARDLGLGRRINTIMQTAFFAISGVLPREQALVKIKEAIRNTYGKQGEEVVRRNELAVDQAAGRVHRLELPASVTATRRRPPLLREGAPDFVERVTRLLLAGQGDLLPVSAFPPDGTWPTGTARWEKRNLALEIPVWDEELCIQCNKCALVCPHAAVRVKVYEPAALTDAPPTFRSVPYRSNELKDLRYTIQVAPEDCTGCTLCVRVCPAKDKSNPRHKALDMAPQMPLRDVERENFDFFLSLPQQIEGEEVVRSDGSRQPMRIDVKGSQFLEPLFEFSGACSGCGETPYIKLLTQLFGDRLLIANATGCSSIYGANLPTTPYAVNAAGRGPAWSNSLFEDNAEFGLGYRLSLDQAEAEARPLLASLAPLVGETLADEILTCRQDDEIQIRQQRERVAELQRRLMDVAQNGQSSIPPERRGGLGTTAPIDWSTERGGSGATDVGTNDSLQRAARRLLRLSEHLVRKSVWIVGGDGWAYDIGFGGVDHVLSMERNVNLLVLDTEVYSNTGGQASKATPLGATAKFAMGGKAVGKKDLGLMAMAYGHVYVAQVAFGAKDAQTVRALQEADSYPGPSLVIAYSSCIAHGYDMSDSLDHQKMASDSGLWPLYRFDPRRTLRGDNPLQLESKTPTVPFAKFAETEGRFRMLIKSNPARAKELFARADRSLRNRYDVYEQLSHLHVASGSSENASDGDGASQL